MSASKARMQQEIGQLTRERDEARRLLAEVVRHTAPADGPEWPLAEPAPGWLFLWVDSLMPRMAESVLAWHPGAALLIRRNPQERVEGLALKRRECEAAGESTEHVDVAERVLAERDRQVMVGLLRQVLGVVEVFCYEHRVALSVLPPVMSRRLITEAVVAFLYAQGMVALPPSGVVVEWVGGWRECVPEHLRPPVDLVLASYERACVEQAVPESAG